MRFCLPCFFCHAVVFAFAEVNWHSFVPQGVLPQNVLNDSSSWGKHGDGLYEYAPIPHVKNTSNALDWKEAFKQAYWANQVGDEIDNISSDDTRDAFIETYAGVPQIKNKTNAGEWKEAFKQMYWDEQVPDELTSSTSDEKRDAFIEKYATIPRVKNKSNAGEWKEAFKQAYWGNKAPDAEDSTTLHGNTLPIALSQASPDKYVAAPHIKSEQESEEWNEAADEAAHMKYPSSTGDDPSSTKPENHKDGSLSKPQNESEANTPASSSWWPFVLASTTERTASPAWLILAAVVPAAGIIGLLGACRESDNNDFSEPLISSPKYTHSV